MKKVILVLFALGLMASCTTESLTDESTKKTTAFDQEGGCSAPDTNCNGIPDCEEDENNNGIPDCEE